MNKAITFQQQLWGINGFCKSVGYKSIEQSTPTFHVSACYSALAYLSIGVRHLATNLR